MFLAVILISIGSFTGQPRGKEAQFSECRYERYQRLAEKKYRNILKQERKLQAGAHTIAVRKKKTWFFQRKMKQHSAKRHRIRRADRCSRP